MIAVGQSSLYQLKDNTNLLPRSASHFEDIAKPSCLYFILQQHRHSREKYPPVYSFPGSHSKLVGRKQACCHEPVLSSLCFPHLAEIPAVTPTPSYFTSLWNLRGGLVFYHYCIRPSSYDLLNLPRFLLLILAYLSEVTFCAHPCVPSRQLPLSYCLMGVRNKIKP